MLSIDQLTIDYLVNCEFSNDYFVIKDQVTQMVLMKGLKQHNLYTVRASLVAFFSSRFQAVPSCQLGKMSKLLFPFSVSSTLAPFEKLHTDLWGPTFVTSINKFIYYAAIVDDFKKFI